ncbi:hypothetical protein ACSBR2_039917 [Camellia fascicularis]
MEGGWNLILRKRRMGKQTSRSKENELVTLFVDEVPESMTRRELSNLFSKFGVVKDVFIPMKMRKITRTRFGFVRWLQRWQCKKLMAYGVIIGL